MIISVLAITFLEGKAEAGLAALRVALESTRGFNGCLGAEVARDVNDPHRINIIERWQSLAHDSAYRAWAAGRGSASPLAGLLAAPPSKSVCELLEGV